MLSARAKISAGLAALAILAGTAGVALAQYRPDMPDTSTPMALSNPTITEKPNAQLPLDLSFTDSAGKSTTLGALFNHNKPVVVSLVYFSCPKLCGLNQEGLADAVHHGPRDLVMGKDYDVVVVSIDPDDTPAAATVKRDNYLKLMGHTPPGDGLTYLTGTEATIKTLADTIGFGYYRNPKPDMESGKYAHSTGYFICTPEGKLSQTIGGIALEPDQLHLSLVKASEGKIGGGLLSVALSCGAMRYNPATGKYEANPWFYAGTAGGICSIIFMATFLSLLFRSDTKRKIIDDPSAQDSEPKTQD